MLHFLSNKITHTNHRILINRILGQWIIQSTLYSFTKKQVNNLTNQIKLSHTKKQNKKFSVILKENYNNLQMQHFTTYIVEQKNSSNSNIIYQVFLFNDKIKYGYILTFNHHFAILKKHIILYYSNNYVNISYNNKVNISQKIYFLNDNLKITKCIIKKNHQYYCLCFSSEIKLS